MSENDQKVLKALSDVYYGEDFCFVGFKYLEEITGLSRREVRISCRRLARKGLARYRKGLWTEDGTPAGSGYAAIIERAA